MTARSPARAVPFPLHALGLVALAVVAACSKEPAATPAAPLATASDVAPAGTLPAQAGDVAQAPPQAPVRVAAATTARPTDDDNSPIAYDPPAAGQPPYVNESAAPDALVYADDPEYANDDQQQVISVWDDPPLEQPAPVAVDWAPPPMLVEELPPPPYPEAVWTGGYWGWQGRWVWCAGRWSRPPRPDYRWHEPYYEHRGDKVVFVPAYWSAPDRHFIAPAAGIVIVAAIIAVGVHAGHHADGPQGVFVPPPPGSRPGIIVPAPIGTPPRVVVGAPPVINVGMRVNGNVENNSHNVTNNITNITNVRNVTIVAPPTATATGRGFQQAVVADPHRPSPALAGARPTAPRPQSATPVAAWQPGRPAPVLPAAQPVRGVSARGERPGRPDMPTPNDPRAARQPAQQQAQQQAQQAQQLQQAQQERAGKGLPPLTPQQAQALGARQAEAQRMQQQDAQRGQQQQRVQQEQAQKAQQEQAQQAQQQRAQQEQAQKAQQEQAQRAQQQAQQQRAQQEQAQKAQQEQAQRAQQQAQQQRAQQEQAQKAQQEQAQRAQQAQRQRAQQEQALKAQQEQQQRAQPQSPPQRPPQEQPAKAKEPEPRDRQRKPDDNDRK
jgi:hypothetical protein